MRSRITSGATSRLMVPASTSMTMESPSCTAAIGPPLIRLGHDVRHHETVRRAAETAVGHQRHAFRKSFAHDRPGDAQHLAHARTAARPFIPDHHHVARLNTSAGHRGHGLLFAIEHARRTAMLHAVVSRQLDHAAIGRQRSAQNRHAAARLQWLRSADESLPGPESRAPRRLLRRRCGPCTSARSHPRNRLPPAVARSRRCRRPYPRPPPRTCRPASDPPIRGVRRQISWKSSIVERHAGLARHRQQMQHRVGGSARGRDTRDGIGESRARGDLRAAGDSSAPHP